MALAPNIALYLSENLDQVDTQRAIMGVIRAAETYAFRELGISASLWTEAQRIMGIWQATLAIMIVAAKDPDYFSRTPAHYFVGMVEKSQTGNPTFGPVNLGPPHPFRQSKRKSVN